ncbi:MAG: sigma factor, partial [Oscillospiraceae bacterium]
MFSLKQQRIFCVIRQKFLDLLGFRRRTDYINGSQTLPAPLPRDEEQRMFDLLYMEPDYARNELITHNLRLVVYIARKFESTGINLEDLISIGTIGLIKA